MQFLSWTNIIRNNLVDSCRIRLNDNNEDVNTKLFEGTESETTLLCFATQLGRSEIAEMIIRQPNINLNAVNYENMSPLMIACYYKKIAVLRILAQQPGFDLNLKTTDGWTALHYACRSCEIDYIKILVDLGCDINAETSKGVTPLGCTNKPIGVELQVIYKIVDYLLENGAHTRGFTCDSGKGYNVTAISVESKFEGRIQLFQWKSIIDTNNLSKCKNKLASKIPDINGIIKISRNKSVPILFYACKRKRIGIIRILLQEDRIDVNATNSDNASSLFIACQDGSTEIVKMLVYKNDTDLNIRNNKGLTCIHYACFHGHLDIVSILLDKDANLRIKSNAGLTPLGCAKSEEIADLLIAKAVDTSGYVCNPDNINILSDVPVAEKYGVRNENQLDSVLSMESPSKYSSMELIMEVADSELPESVNLNFEHSVVFPVTAPRGAEIKKIKEINNLVYDEPDIPSNWESLIHNSDIGSIYAIISVFSPCLINEIFCVNINGSIQYHTPLSYAYLLNKSELGIFFLERGAMPDWLDTFGNSMLHRFITNNANLDSINLMIQNGSDLNHLNQRNESPLMSAIKLNKSEIVALLVQHNAPLKLRYSKSMTNVLFYAIYQNQPEILKLFLTLEQCMPFVSDLNGIGQSLLDMTIFIECCSCLEVLLADPIVHKSLNNAQIAELIKSENENLNSLIVNFLVSERNVKNNFSSELISFIISQDVDIPQLLKAKDMIKYCVQNDKNLLAEKLLMSGLDCTKDALILAVEKGLTAVVKLMVENGKFGREALKSLVLIANRRNIQLVSMLGHRLWELENLENFEKVTKKQKLA